VANARGCGPEGIGQGIMAGIEIRPNHARGECRSLVDRQQTEARLAAEAGEKPYPPERMSNNRLSRLGGVTGVPECREGTWRWRHFHGSEPIPNR
jgi:hypothetical protein